MSKSVCNETTILLSQEAQLATDTQKDSSYCKKSVLSVLLVVGGLAIFIFIGLMIKWHMISQSVITPSQYDVKNSQDGHVGDDERQDYCPGCGYGGGGATAAQLGKAFPLYVLAQIAWKDLSDMIFDTSHMGGDKSELAYGKSLIPSYLSQSDCKYAINYFEDKFGAHGDSMGYQERDCQYLDLNTDRYDCDVNCGLDRGEYEQDHDLYDLEGEDIHEQQFQIQRMAARIVDYFYDNYENVLSDSYVSDITMIKYISNGKGFSGLHSENYYIDGQEIILTGDVKRNVDYVAIVFLNHDFIGGDLQFIGSNAIHNVNAQTGNGVLFGGGLEYSHRVSPVTNGHRYVVKIVFNKKKSH